MNEQGLSRLREFLFKEFNEEELAALCQEIGLNYGELPGEGAFGKTRGMIEAAQARDTIPLLMSRVRDLRPAAYRIAAIRQPTAHVTPPAPPAAAAAITATQSSGSRVRPLVILFVIVACLVLAVGAAMLNQFMLNQRRNVPAEEIATSAMPAASATADPSQTNTPAVPTDTPPAQATATTKPTGTPLATDTPIATASPTLMAAATSARTVTPQPVVATATTTASPTEIVMPSATAPVSNTVSAIQAILQANDLLATFYSGQASDDALRAVWAGDTYSFVIAYPTKMLKRNLGVDAQPGVGMTATLRYVREPAILSDNDSRIVLTSRESWAYKVGVLIVCETVDYSYTVAKAERYLIVAYKGDVIAANTAGGCE